MEGLAVDWEYVPESARDQRAHPRLDMTVMARLIDGQQIVVKVATSRQTYEGRLVDISEGGLALILPVALAPNLPVKVGLVLGRARILSRARVRHVKPEPGGVVTGLQFVDLPHESSLFIGELYAAKVLSHAA